MNVNFLNQKEDQRLPDAYTMTFRVNSRETMQYEVASHVYSDVTYFRNEKGQIIGHAVSAVPYWEIRTVENLFVNIPATMPVEFDLRYSKIIELREEELRKGFGKAQKAIEVSPVK